MNELKLAHLDDYRELSEARRPEELLRSVLLGQANLADGTDEELAAMAVGVLEASSAIRVALAELGQLKQEAAPISFDRVTFRPLTAREWPDPHPLELQAAPLPGPTEHPVPLTEHPTNVPTASAWRAFRLGLIAALSIIVTSMFTILANADVGIAGIYAGFSVLCVADYVAAVRNDHNGLLLPPTVARMGVLTFAALAILVAIASS